MKAPDIRAHVDKQEINQKNESSHDPKKVDKDTVSTILDGVEDFKAGRVVSENEFFKKLNKLGKTGTY